MAQRLFGLTLRLFGLGLAGTGAAHFLAPEPFDRLTAVAFPDETRRWTLSNGATELILGLAVASRRTRLVGLAGFLAYAAFLTQRLISTQNSQN
ncbi:hypothetical protein F6W96_06670 [Nocardia terpenica]|uniref:DoxX family membrane protein n=2 Tax=Nocardia terpenica TaxID=455432 RepID=A0A6G9ZF12_9NOCA|nr:hypothetical protein F6W96_06670 [Nocardia terpenica]